MINPGRNRTRHRNRLTRGIFWTVGLALLSACTALPFNAEPNQTAKTAGSQNEVRRTAPNCLLPGRVKRLAPQFVYIAPRQAVKTSPEDCRLRGGEILSRKF